MAKDMLDYNIELEKKIDTNKKIKVGIIGTIFVFL